jgi:hypothetical protein
MTNNSNKTLANPWIQLLLGVICMAAVASMQYGGRRRLAAGLTAAGSGVGAAFTNAPVAHMIHVHGHQHAFLLFGLLLGLSAAQIAALKAASVI